MTLSREKEVLAASLSHNNTRKSLTCCTSSSSAGDQESHDELERNLVSTLENKDDSNKRHLPQRPPVCHLPSQEASGEYHCDVLQIALGL